MDTVDDGARAMPLRGFTVGVTASRRKDELTAAFERRGARVFAAPAIRIVPLPDDRRAHEATRACISAKLDIAIATTAVGFRGWIEAADSWGVGDDLRARLGSCRLLTRGAKVRGAVRANGLIEDWSAPSESMQQVLDHLLAEDLEGKRIAVQLHGEPLPDLVEKLTAAGADVVPVQVYRWTLPQDPAPVQRLVDQAIAGQIDALTFTSAPAVAGMLEVARRAGKGQRLIDVLTKDVLAICVGPVCAGPLRRVGVEPLIPERSRLGHLIRLTTQSLEARCDRPILAAGHEIDLRGHAVVIDGATVTLPPAPMAILRALAREPGRVYSRGELAPLLPGEDAGTHAVEMAVTRLRSLLATPGIIQTVVKRGYRLDCDSRATPAPKVDHVIDPPHGGPTRGLAVGANL